MQCVTWSYTKIVCLAYAIVVLLIPIKIHLLNTKLVSLTHSIDHKVKIFKDCPTECYRYCVFVCQWHQTSLRTWVSVPIHAPDCVCRSLALAHPSYFYTNWFLTLTYCIKISNQRYSLTGEWHNVTGTTFSWPTVPQHLVPNGLVSQAIHPIVFVGRLTLDVVWM